MNRHDRSPRGGSRGEPRCESRGGVAVLAALGSGLLVTGLLAGCGSGSATSGDGSGSGAVVAAGGPGGVGGLVSALERPSGDAASGTGVASSPGPTVTGTGVTSGVPTRPGSLHSVAPGQLYFFETPSKNIGCQLASDSVRCDIAVRDWAAPARPSTCEFDYGNGVFVAGGAAGYVCAGDTVLHAPNAVPLPYGDSVTAGVFACLSTTAGVTCRNSSTGHGFVLSRQAYAPF